MKITREQYFGSVDAIMQNDHTTVVVEKQKISQNEVVEALTPDDINATNLDQIINHFRTSLGGRLNGITNLKDLKFELYKSNEVPPLIRRNYGRALTPAARFFHTVDELRHATLEQIKEVPGVRDYYANFLFFGFKPQEKV